MKEKDRTQQELEVEEVNFYSDDCGRTRFACLTDCPFSLPLLTSDY